MNEASITIAGRPLTQSQSMAVRVAVTNMLTEMSDPAALGDDGPAREITAGYHSRLTEVISLILRGV